MRQVSLREFRTRGAKVLRAVPEGETVLLSGQKGPAYFLVPVLGDVAQEDRELRRAMAKASLRRNWRLAEASATKLSDEEIDREIRQVRAIQPRNTSRRSKKTK
jgi:antitoxin (DNA-binding transcriptional repressor) of toxin-antitoxin stability system